MSDCNFTECEWRAKGRKLQQRIDELERLLRMAKSVSREDTSSDIQWENAKTKVLHPQEQSDD